MTVEGSDRWCTRERGLTTVSELLVGSRRRWQPNARIKDMVGR